MKKMTSYKVNRKTTFVGGRLLSKEESYADAYDFMSYAKNDIFICATIGTFRERILKPLEICHLPSIVKSSATASIKLVR